MTDSNSVKNIQNYFEEMWDKYSSLINIVDASFQEQGLLNGIYLGQYEPGITPLELQVQ